MNSKYNNKNNNNNNFMNNNNAATDKNNFYNHYANYTKEKTSSRTFANKKHHHHHNKHQLQQEYNLEQQQQQMMKGYHDIPVHDLLRGTTTTKRKTERDILNGIYRQHANHQHHLKNESSTNLNSKMPIHTKYESYRLYGGSNIDTINPFENQARYAYYKKAQISENIKKINNAYRAERKLASPPLVQQFDPIAAFAAASSSANKAGNGAVAGAVAVNNNTFPDTTDYHHHHNERHQQRYLLPKTDQYDGDINRNTGNITKSQSPFKNYKTTTDEHYNRYYFYEYNRTFSSPQHQQSPHRGKANTILPSPLMDPYENQPFLEDNKKLNYNESGKSPSAVKENHKEKSKRKHNHHNHHNILDFAIKPTTRNYNAEIVPNGFLPDIEVIKGGGDNFDSSNDNVNKRKEGGGIKIDRTPYPPLQSRSSTYMLDHEQNLNTSRNDEQLNEVKKTPSNTTRKAKGPRVLLYNTASPRLQRKPSSTNISIRTLSHQRLLDSKKSVKIPSVIANRIRVKDQMKPKDSLEIECFAIRPSEDESKPTYGDTHPTNGVVLTKDFGVSDLKTKDNDDCSSSYSDDDDLDNNASDFIGSDDSEASSDAEEGYRSYALKFLHPAEKLHSQHYSAISPQTSEESLRTPSSLLVPSLFPHVPPYLSFSSNVEKGPDVPPELHRILKWRVSNVMPKVVRCVLANSGMRLVKKTNEWIGVWGKHMKSPCFKAIRPYQKINHLPGSFKIGRKDSCWKNLKKNMGKHSKRDFGFMPKTYIIPNDLHNLRKHWPRYAQQNLKWIIKPPASARGFGIRVINRWAQIPKRKPLIVQRYIERPLLINGSKFDLRLYVLVTSINPLRVFLYHNGLARFASVKYSDRAETLSDRCMHLTNYSINKFSSNYSKNDDVNACHGHKWTLKSLWTYLASRGVRTDSLWEAMRSLVLRTILAGENTINNMVKYNVESKYSCYELFGFDVILDSELIPWLLEVNISPSLHSDLPLDAHVKAPLVQGVLNTALFNIPPKLSFEKQREIAAQMNYKANGPICFDKRMHVKYLTREEKAKHEQFARKNMESRDEYLNGILEHLTPDDVRTLIIAEDELARCAPLERIFPTRHTHKYLKFTDNPRYYNRLLDAWENRYGHNRQEGINLLRRYCEIKYHLQVPPPPAKRLPKYRTRAMKQQILINRPLRIAALKRINRIKLNNKSKENCKMMISKNDNNNLNLKNMSNMNNSSTSTSSNSTNINNNKQFINKNDQRSIIKQIEKIEKIFKDLETNSDSESSESEVVSSNEIFKLKQKVNNNNNSNEIKTENEVKHENEHNNEHEHDNGYNDNLSNNQSDQVANHESRKNKNDSDIMASNKLNKQKIIDEEYHDTTDDTQQQNYQNLQNPKGGISSSIPKTPNLNSDNLKNMATQSESSPNNENQSVSDHKCQQIQKNHINNSLDAEKNSDTINENTKILNFHSTEVVTNDTG